LKLTGMKIVVDAANGAGYDIARRVFDELGADVISVGAEPNGLNINKDCGATAPDNLRAHVLLERADVGIALDGDGDRLIMVDHRGEIVDGDEILYVIAKARHESGNMHGGVAGTLMTNLGLEHALAGMNIPFARAGVGDRFVMELLKEKDWQIGGENSGHIICLDRVTTGDAIVAALEVLSVVRQSGEPLSKLRADMQMYPQVLKNVPLTKKVDISDNPAINDAVKQAEASLGDSGRILLRASGTEPLIRVMVEGRVANDVERICGQVAKTVGDELG